MSEATCGIACCKAGPGCRSAHPGYACCPFDPEKGTMYIRETLKILDGIDMSKAKRKAIMSGNLEKITGKKLG